VIFGEDLTALLDYELVKAINRCEVRLKSEFPDVLWSFFEPDLSD